jgi:hypothetical protein
MKQFLTRQLKTLEKVFTEFNEIFTIPIFFNILMSVVEGLLVIMVVMFKFYVLEFVQPNQELSVPIVLF